MAMIIVGGPAIYRNLKLPSGKLDTTPLTFSQKKLSLDPEFGSVQFCPVSVLTDGVCEDSKSQMLSPSEALFIAADPRGKKDATFSLFFRTFGCP